MTPADNPYLSLIVAARYDDHGGSFMHRMQAFLNAFIAQCREYQLPAEVVVVEWNPLPDRCKLAQALEWPVEMDWCKVRFVEVPPQIHARYRHGDQLPLYQMIAKNVALRHVRGEWVLATNVDIFFNDALLRFLAGRRLARNKMYRIDRYDADEAIPLWATVDEQLKYCETHLLRIMSREGTFTLNAKGLRQWDGSDITLPEDGIAFESGWFSPEVHYAGPIRHIDDKAVLVLPPLPADNTLLLKLEPSTGADGPVTVRLVREDGSVAAAQVVNRCALMWVPLTANSTPTKLMVEIEAKRWVVPYDPRDLILKAWQVVLEVPPNGGERRRLMETPTPNVEPEPMVATAPRPSPTFADHAARWLRETAPSVHAVLAPVYRSLTGKSNHVPIPAQAPSLGEELPERVPEPAPPVRIGAPAGECPPVYLHTNACGDFTLMHIDHWRDLRGYAEFDAYSMNIDSVLCWAAHFAGAKEEILREPMRLYHVEHGRGSGWTPEGRDILYRRIKAAGLPWIEYPDLMSWVRSMNELNCPIIFNKRDWGLRGEVLRESAPDPDAAHLRWCAQDPASPSQLKARAECLLKSPGTSPGERQAIADTCERLSWRLGPRYETADGTELVLDLRTAEGRRMFVYGQRQ